MALIEGAALQGFSDEHTMGIRAEHLSLAQPGKGRLTCRVTDCEFLGSETFIGLAHDQATGLTLKSPGLVNMPPGDEVEINFADANLHAFDKQGRRATTP